MATTPEERAIKAAYQREWCAKNRERSRELARESQARNKEKRAAYHKEWAAANRQKLKEYRQKWVAENKDDHKATTTAWRKANAEKIREQKRILYASNPDVRKRNEEWSAAHPEVKKASKQNRRARERSAEGSFTGQEFLDLCQMYGNRCLCCGEYEKLTADHVVPISKGGSNFIENIQPLCNPCNKRKSARVVDYRPEFHQEEAA